MEMASSLRSKGSERSYPDLPEIGIEALGMNRVRRSCLLAELLESRDAAEYGHAVDPQNFAVRRFRQLDPLALGLEARGVDPPGRDGPKDIRLASAAGAVRRLQLLLDSGRQGLQRALALLFLDEERAVGKRDEIHGIAPDLRRGRGRDEVPLLGPGHAVNSGRVPGGRHATWFGYPAFTRKPLMQALAPEESHYWGSMSP